MKPIQFLMLKRLMTSVFFYVSILLLLVFACLVSFQVTKMGQKSSIPALILVSHGVMDAKKIVFFIIPLFLALQMMITDMYNRFTVLLKYDRVGKWWRDVFVSTSLFSLMMMIVIQGSTFLGSFLLIPDRIERQLFPYVMFHMGIVWISFIAIGCVYHVLVLLLKNQYIALFLTTFAFFLQDMSKSILRVDFLSLPALMALEYKLRYQVFTVFPSDVIVFGVVGGATAILYLVGYLLVRDKDFYWSA
ncbi:hypothetical protein [Brevibacillus sp. SAFN-007a]|uniref:hypothetical protein n=1 Tax=Brevibacillus sp. SAFN-007a TaxID=3436862 RepID=UPI003F8092CC